MSAYDAPASPHTTGTLAFIWRYLSYRVDLLIIFLVCAIVMVAAELSIPLMVMRAVDGVLAGEVASNLNIWFASMIGLLGVLYIFHVGLLRLEVSLILQASYNLRKRLYEHIHAQALPFFERHSTGALMHRVTSDTEQFEEEASSIFRDLPSEIMTVLGVTIMIIALDLRMAALVLVFMSLASAIAWYIGQPLADIRTSAQNIASGLSARLQETLSGIRTVKAFKNEAFELEILDQENLRTLETERNEGRIEAWMEPLSDMIGVAGLVLVVWFGTHLIQAGTLTPGGLIAFIAYMEILARPLGNVERYLRSYQTCKAVGGRLQDLFADVSTLPVTQGKAPDIDALSLRFDSVRFSYPRSNRTVLDGLDFAVAPRERVALVGTNGAGKSTLTDLLLRFYDPDTGTVSAGGTSLKAWPLETWRRQVGVMTQNTFLFRGTLRDNIAYGRPDASQSDILKAVKASGFDQILKRFPNGLLTHVGEHGASLSGGEQQSLAFARLCLKNPAIAILDEPTAHLDSETLRETRAAITRFMQSRTVFLISHDPDMINLCDRVLFLNQGRIVADGSHAQLLSENALYRAIWTRETEAA